MEFFARARFEVEGADFDKVFHDLIINKVSIHCSKKLSALILAHRKKINLKG